MDPLLLKRLLPWRVNELDEEHNPKYSSARTLRMGIPNSYAIQTYFYLQNAVDNNHRRRKLLVEEYIANGNILGGKVFSRSIDDSITMARVQYDVVDASTSMILRYEKTIYGRHSKKSGVQGY
eukprot:scaffold1372_cov289-Chaetoceros_neogracile.AAC.4